MGAFRVRGWQFVAVVSFCAASCNDADDDAVQVVDAGSDVTIPDASPDGAADAARETSADTSGGDTSDDVRPDASTPDVLASEADGAPAETDGSALEIGAVNADVSLVPADAVSDQRSPDALAVGDGSTSEVGRATLGAVVPFDPQARQFPEGVARKGNDIFLSMGPLFTVVRVDEGGTVHEFGTLPKVPTPPGGFLTGLEFAPSGELYVGLVSADPEVKTGIYRIAASGGAGTLAYSDPAMSFPNDILFDPSGNMFVTDSSSGIVFRVASGTLGRWAESDLLRGDRTACGLAEGDRAIGANGIVRGSDGTFYVANTDRGLIVKIPAVGTPAGTAEVFVRSCERLRGADGLAIAADGSIVVLVNRRDAIERVSADGQLDEIARGGILDFPASIVLEPSGLGGWLTNFPNDRARQGKPTRPALLRIEL